MQELNTDLLVKDLLLGESTGEVFLEGFLPIEPDRAWRWTVGNRQSISFYPLRGHQRLSYRFHLLRSGLKLSLEFGDQNFERDCHEGMLSGSIDFFCEESDLRKLHVLVIKLELVKSGLIE